ncbi:MAG: hypothetical protein HY910_12105 [Desulfarculus sp.]|nr:hypothetical protein [Desulfarculus sp.]
MSFDLTETKSIFFNPDELATAVVLWPGTPQERTINAIWREAAHTASLGQAQVDAGKPAILCHPSDLEGVKAGQGSTPLTIPANPRLLVPGGNYTVARNQPDGSGFRLLYLHEARP